VFFSGGRGSPKQFEQQCRYFASRGLVAIATDLADEFLVSLGYLAGKPRVDEFFTAVTVEAPKP
jgi:hypothetical protein